MIGVRLAGKESDKEHPYGHERMECVAAIILSGILLATGLIIGYQGIQKILHPEDLQIPGVLALAAAVLSIIVKEIMYQYTRKAAKQIDSDALMADARHHRSDALSSVGALIGIAGARLGLPVLDPIASLVICLFIARAAYMIFRDAVNKMVDQSADEETEAALRACALAYPGVIGIDRLMTRKFGSRMYVEMEISVDGSMTLTAAHAIAEGVHSEIERQFPRVKHIMIHVNPAETVNSKEK
jgi:cation diffusion facilitator family transporter